MNISWLNIIIIIIITCSIVLASGHLFVSCCCCVFWRSYCLQPVATGTCKTVVDLHGCFSLLVRFASHYFFSDTE